MKVILYQPQIPQNTGNIARTCSMTGTELILVEPLGFSLSDRWMRRAGLDYWSGVNLKVIDDLESFLEKADFDFYFFSSKASKGYHQITYGPHDALVFGSEVEGLPKSLFEKWSEKYVTIPMRQGLHPEREVGGCLNLATSVGIGLYEAWRQRQFSFLS